ncbi:MAG: DNA/RNA nuclease SfsA [Oscillospiraceae bacterium]|nr:DNA/RNA nuclease SfsA [Oscillospiraceae bacterium]
MTYENMVRGVFISRPNRFIALCETPEGVCRCHVKNTGRCRELLLPGTPVWLQHHEQAARKTAYSLIQVEKAGRLVNMDSQAPNKIFREGLENGAIRLPGMEGPLSLIRPETVFGDSRFDFYLESGDQKAFVEVKGVTLEEEGTARFPDAPTERGVKHLRGLMEARRQGYFAYAVFIIQMEGTLWLEPNDRTHPQFGDALRQAAKAGVVPLAWGCEVSPGAVWARAQVPVWL